jgi:Flp pilus assembly pilin Flp
MPAFSAFGIYPFPMTTLFRRFLKDEQGQDLIEYTLPMVFAALASAASFVRVGGSVSGIWGTASTQLSSANSSASQLNSSTSSARHRVPPGSA